MHMLYTPHNIQLPDNAEQDDIADNKMLSDSTTKRHQTLRNLITVFI